MVIDGDEYVNDTGALSYKQAGEKKYWSILAKMAGIKGHLLDTPTSIKNTETFRH